MADDTNDSELYFKGTILPKPIATNPQIDFENGYFLCKEENTNFDFSQKFIYDAIKKQNPELLKSLSKIQIEDYDKKEFINLLQNDEILDKPNDKIKIPKIENKLLNELFGSFQNSIKKVFIKDSTLYITKSKIDIKDDTCTLGWLKTNTFEIYTFADVLSSTYLDYYISGHSNTLKNTIDQSVLNNYKKLMLIWKEQYEKLTEQNINIGVTSITNSIMQKHFLKNPKYYIVEVELENIPKPIQIYITLKKVKNV